MTSSISTAAYLRTARPQKHVTTTPWPHGSRHCPTSKNTRNHPTTTRHQQRCQHARRGGRWGGVAGCHRGGDVSTNAPRCPPRTPPWALGNTQDLSWPTAPSSKYAAAGTQALINAARDKCHSLSLSCAKWQSVATHKQPHVLARHMGQGDVKVDAQEVVIRVWCV